MTRYWLWVGLLSAGIAGAALSEAGAQQQKVGAPPEASNMKLVGWSDLQARSAYQPTIHKQGERWIAYIGHHGGTDDIPTPVNPMTGQPSPTAPRSSTSPIRRRRNTCATSPARRASTRTAARRWCGCATAAQLPKGDKTAVYMLRSFGGQAHEIWNVADPSQAQLLITRLEGLRDTHKNWWECDTGIAYLVGGAHGLAHQAHDADLRPLRSGQAGEDPRLRPARPGAGRDRRRADRPARADLDRAAGQPRLFRLRHQQGRRDPDRRPREAAEGRARADARQPARARGRPAA